MSCDIRGAVHICISRTYGYGTDLRSNLCVFIDILRRIFNILEVI